jgi:hypothetical protein
LFRGNALVGTGVANQSFSDRSRFLLSHQPAGDIATEDVNDDIQIEVASGSGAREMGDIPAPDPIWSGGHQNRFADRGMLQVVASLSHLLIVG